MALPGPAPRHSLLAPDSGPVVLLVLVALFGINCFAIGWRDAYDVTVQIKSPLETTQPWVAVVLSAGWSGRR